MAETGSRRAHTILTRSSSSNSCPTEVSARNAWLCIKQVTGFANSVGTRIAALAFSGLQSARFGVKEAEQISTKAVSMWARRHNAYHSRRAPIARPQEKAPSKRGRVSPYCGKTSPGSLAPGPTQADALRERPRGAEASRFHAGENEKAPRRSGAGDRRVLLERFRSLRRRSCRRPTRPAWWATARQPSRSPPVLRRQADREPPRSPTA
jgi:hypothetical protein